MDALEEELPFGLALLALLDDDAAAAAAALADILGFFVFVFGGLALGCGHIGQFRAKSRDLVAAFLFTSQIP